MGFTLSQLRQSRITATHPGAVAAITYYVNGDPYCLEPLTSEGKEDQFCSHEAGFGTDHFGTGRCRYHFGHIIPGKFQRTYGKHLKRELRQRFQEFSQQDDIELMDLRPELILLRTILTDTINVYQDTRSARAMDLSLRILDNISSTVDRIDKIQSRQTLTAAMAKKMFLDAITLIRTFLPPDQVPQFIEAWKAEVIGVMGNPNALVIEANVLEDDNE